MASVCSNSDGDSISDDDSEFEYILGYYQPIETENPTADSDHKETHDGIHIEPYSNEPLADEEWTTQYELRQAEKQRRLEGLKDRLTGKESVVNWCTCGNCSTVFLQNAKECYCCQDIEQCTEALTSELVLEETQTPPNCITLHPGFNTVCLDKWSLRLSAGKYRTIDKKTYKKTGSEEAFMRSVAYREFTQLVHGRVGKNRIPLPACAYNAIRTKFQQIDNVTFTGFQEDEDE